MNKSFFLKLKLLLVGLCFFSITIHSQNYDTQINLQDSTQVHVIYLKNGKKVIGRILEIKNEKISFKKKKKKENISLTLSEIQRIKVRGNLGWNKKKYSSTFRHNQFLFYENTGFSLQDGEKSYQTFMGASLLRDFGLSDAVSIGLGYSFPLWFHGNIKFSTPKPKKGATSFKSNFSIFPLLGDDDAFYILKNTLAQTFGTPDYFFNISFSNFYIKTEDNFFFRSDYIPRIYNSISLGGGFRMNENWQLTIENRVNFNNKFIISKLLPSFGFNYMTSKYQVGFGFQSPNDKGFDLYPILELNEDNPFLFSPQNLSKLPFFIFSKIL